MSRVIVKNLPNKIQEKKLRTVFEAHGTVTDVQLKYTSAGKFRNFAFVGFQNEAQAENAKNALDKSFINTSQISVDMCVPLDDPKKPRAWSKHSLESSAKKLKDTSKETIQIKKEKSKKTTLDKVEDLLKSHKGDALFEEFMEAHLPEKRELWKKGKDEASMSDDENDDEELKEADKSISDMEYLKRKKVEVEETKVEEKPSNKPILLDRFTVKITNLPCTVKKPEIKEFIKPAKPASIRIPVKIKGIAYCDFIEESEMKKALMKNRSFMGTRRVIVRAVEKEKQEVEKKMATKRKREEDRLDQAETVAESGRLFLRNLAYTVVEDDLRPIFEKYGPLSELNLPIDPMSRKAKGFGFVTFLIPEHACRALNELDGSVLHGRMLHILPGIAKVEETEDDDAGLSWKEKKMKKQKQLAKNKINWNTFFINENCLAEAMAEKYNTTKQGVLTDSRAGGGAAVRLALGETELVQNTKNFLLQNGVMLESFENMGDEARSETVILVKNLPYKTEEFEIRDKFAPFGDLKCLLMSPYGGTAIVEFIEPSEARKAFQRLAYSKFKHIPLYLEWAPKAIFDGRKAREEEAKKAQENKTQEAAKERGDNKDTTKENEDEEARVHIPQEGTTIYVKGINFSSNAEALKNHFSQCGKVISSIVAEKRDPRNPGQKLSMGYGFVEYADKESADKALKTLQFSIMDGLKIELKKSNRTTKESAAAREKSSVKGKPSSKLIVRNIPFQATQNEIRDLFKVFGEIKALRLPKKMVGTGSHRGFCFIEYHTMQDAKKAFKALSESTHLYGRRLVLEWAETDDDVDTLRQKTAKQFTSSTHGEKRKNITLDDTVPDEDD